eukprot:1495015-Rhodomonas_salina.1
MTPPLWYRFVLCRQIKGIDSGRPWTAAVVRDRTARRECVAAYRVGQYRTARRECVAAYRVGQYRTARRECVAAYRVGQYRTARRECVAASGGQFRR